MPHPKPLSPLRPLQPDEFLPAIGQWTTLGGLILITAIGATAVLTTVLKYSTSVNAAATVRPTGELRLVQAGATGTVDEIAVQVNQPVQQGEVIARLDATALQNQQQQLQLSLQQGQVQLDRLDQQVQLLNAKLATELESTQQLVAIAEAELARDQRSFRDQQMTTQSELAEAEAALALATSELQRYQQLEEGAVSQLQIEEKQAAVRVAEERVARAQALLNPSTAPLTIAQQRLAQVESQGQAAVATLQQEQTALLQQQAELRSQQAQIQQSLQQLHLDLDRTILRAPSNGVILRLNLRNPNQVVQAGETVAEIAPSREALTIKARVSPQDIGQVHLGQVAKLQITACPYPDYGLLTGEVVAISPDVVAVEPSGSPTSFPTSDLNRFEVTIRPAALELQHGTQRCAVQAGMEVAATIITQEETVLRFLLRKARLMGGV